jgi:predicted SprT family Zn-dependent metalloprotease
MKKHELARSLEHAFDYFNSVLFAGTLPPAIITLQRRKGARGYFHPNAFEQRTGNDTQTLAHNLATSKTHEIAMNPDTFADRTDKEVLSTLVHEMCHHWQAHFGKPGRRGYHNAEWAAKMLEIGLHPYNVDQPEKMTGQRITHRIITDFALDRFDKAADALLSTRFGLHFQSSASLVTSAGSKERNKTKYECSACGLNVWGKPDLRLLCVDCEEPLAEVH